MAVKGVQNLFSNLDKFEAQKRIKQRAALTRIGLKIKADSIRLTPVDTGNLRSSAYMEVETFKRVEIGYTSDYAPFVHENMEQKLKGQDRKSGSGKGKYWETGEPKFLEKAARNAAKFIRDELAKAMKV